jgi:hypothetical protein
VFDEAMAKAGARSAFCLIPIEEVRMIYFMALIPATALTIAAYFVLYLSNRSEGAFRAFGKYLGFWAFALAGLVVLGAVFAAAHGARGGAMSGMRGMHDRIHCSLAGDLPRAGD